MTLVSVQTDAYDCYCYYNSKSAFCYHEWYANSGCNTTPPHAQTSHSLK